MNSARRFSRHSHQPQLTPLGAARWAFLCVGTLLVSGWCGAGCSMLLKGDDVQCRDDHDCLRFTNAVCNRTTQLCIGRPSWPMPMPVVDGSVADGSAPTDGPSTASNIDGPAADVQHVECPDLNGNTVLDCKESLLMNGTFRGDLAGWTSEIDIQQTFVSKDGTDNAASGAIAVINARYSDSEPGSTMGGTEQCVRATDTASYDFAAQALISVRPGDMAWAGVAFQFFTSTDCSGTSNGAFSPTLSTADVAEWQVLRGIVSPPFGTRALKFRLVVVKPFRQQPASAVFDNVLLKVR